MLPISTRISSSALTVAALLAFYPRLTQASDPTNYIGGDQGFWSNPLNWSNGVPSSALDAIINNPSPTMVLLDTNQTTNTLTLNSPDTLSLLTTLSIAGSAVTNTGTILLNATSASPILSIKTNATLSGAGTILMSASSGMLTTSSSSPVRLTTDNLILGQGTLGSTNLKITNNGTIEASTGKLVIAPNSASDGFINAGTLVANGGSLILSTGSYTNTGGIIEAMSGSIVNAAGTLTGGTLAGLGGTIILGTPVVLLQNLTLSGVVVATSTTQINATTISNTGLFSEGSISGLIQANASVIQNNGTITLSSLNGMSLTNSTLSGGGTVVLSSSIISAGWASSSNVIQGNGSITAGLTNSNLIIANTGTLNLSSSIINNGTIQANGGKLLLSGTVSNNGVIEAINSSQAVISSPKIIGGTIRGTDGTIILTGPSQTTMTLQGVTLSGNVVASMNQLFLASVVQNTGTLTPRTLFNLFLNANSGSLTNSGVISIGKSTVTLQGTGLPSATASALINTGSIILTSPSSGIAGGLGIVNNGTISGQGGVDGINNAGLVLANSNTLQLGGSATRMFNSGTLRADGGLLQLLQGTITNTGGIIQAVNGATVLAGVFPTAFTPQPTIIGGTLEALTGGTLFLRGPISGSQFISDASSTIHIDNVGLGFTVSALNNAGLFFLENDSAVVLSGSLTNTGTIQLNNLSGLSPFTICLIQGGTATSLTGGGTIFLTPPSASNHNYSAPSLLGWSGTSNAALITDNFITGAGTLGATQFTGQLQPTLSNFRLVSNGQVLVTGSNWITITTADTTDGAITNNGLFQANGGTLLLSQGPVTNNGTISALYGGQVLVDTHVSGGGLTAISGNITFKPNATASKFTGLSLDGGLAPYTSSVDLTSNGLIVQSDPTILGDKAAKTGMLWSGLYNGLNGGNWLGHGINSSTVASDASATGSHLTALALYDNADLNLPSFGGQPADSNSLLIATARIADANFDNTVNTADLAIVSTHWLTPQNTWSRGDFNYDGTTNAADLTLLANNWQDPQPYPLAIVGFANLAASLGTVTLTANSTYAGTTTIAAGTLIIGNASTSGFAGTGPIINHGQLAFNRSDAVLIPNQISGPGTLTHLGTGTTTLANYQGTGPINVNAGKLAFSPTASPRNTPAVLLQASSLSVSPTTTLDLSNHDMLIHGGSTAAIESKIGTAYYFGLWNYPGITSSSAQANPITTLAILSGTDYNTFSPTPGTFDNTPVLNSDTLLKFTYVGDLNLDGLVNDDDLFIFNGAYFFTGTGNYALGDLNFDGLVNDDDLFLFNGNYFFPPASPLADLSLVSPSEFENQNPKIANPLTPTPEPTTLLLLSLTTPLLLLRRPRHPFHNS